MGDSNTVGTQSFANQLKSYCTGARVTIAAGVGDNTNVMLANLKAKLSSGNKYDVITILGGSNDLGTSIDTKQNLTTMYQLANQHGALVIAITPPSKKYIRTVQPTWGGSIDHYQLLLAKLADIVRWINTNKLPDYTFDFNKITDSPDAFGSDMQHATYGSHKALLGQLVNKLKLTQA